ncbi:histone deacetylase family protein [Sediminitomix flava]|uniref:Acetoin utilization deacetylase AcuC-like enzyme n=1 Tax=Sediminitomix flava TaxID=379075 RepID=A0A315ZB02_SEDFL|nr:histone deacetylase [Sediminitomix flava]PWJ42755.1 acetoin utilization deacetylase AcuC-like enzyme [Sediminitomix flava]
MLKIAYSDVYAHDLPEGHRFPMVKYNLLVEQLLYEGTITKDNLFEPKPVDEKYILDTHDEDYWYRLSNILLEKGEVRRLGFPLTEDLVYREKVINQGTIDCAKYAMEYGVSLNIAGGTHHSFTNKGEGFCLLNDIGMAANYMLNYEKLERILVIDLDVHQGNGTAEIFQNESRVFTFSMHGAKNYPMQKENSDWDIGLPDGIEDEAYLQILSDALPKLFDKVKPQLVFYQSGVDVIYSDKLGRLGLSLNGCKERDRLVFKYCLINLVPVCVSMGGGYSQQLAHIIEAHSNTFRLADQLFF